MNNLFAERLERESFDMRDYVYIGPAPADEDCAQLGSENYGPRARKECRVFIEQLRRHFGNEPPLARLHTQGNDHDFGTYYEVVCDYDDEDQKSIDYAFAIEGSPPERWYHEATETLR